MSKKFFILHSSFFILLFLFCSYGQQSDPRSQRIIDDMTARFKSYPSVSLNFTLNITHLQDDSESEEHEGRIWIKNNMYKLETSDFVIYFDGTNIYQFLPDVNEAYKTKPDPAENDDFQLLNPQTYFNISSNNFRSFLLRETTQNNRSVYEIDLIPIDVLNSRFSRIRVMVERSTLQMVRLNVFMKDGTNYALSFRPYNILQTALRDSFFRFNPSEHPNVEIIDLTF